MADKKVPDPGSKDVLYEAARSAIQDQSARAEAERRAAKRKTNPRRVGLMVLVILIGTVLLVLRPGWLTGPESPPPEAPAIAAASLRPTRLPESQRVPAFFVRQGPPP